MLDFKANPDHHLQEEKNKPDETPCVICGKGIKNPWKHTVHLFWGWTLVMEAEAAKLDSDGDLGAWPIGSDCLKKHPEIIPYLIGEA